MNEQYRIALLLGLVLITLGCLLMFFLRVTDTLLYFGWVLIVYILTRWYGMKYAG